MSTTLAIAMLVAGRLVVPFVDSVVKYLDRRYSPWQLVWARYLVMTVVVLPIALGRHGWRGVLWPPRQPLLVLRGLLQAVATACFFYAIGPLPIADACAILFLSPVLIVLLSALVTRETVSAARCLGVIGGFVAIMLIVKPGFDGFQPASLAALAAAVALAVYTMVTRELRDVPALLVLLYQALPGLLALSLLLPTYVRWPRNGVDALLMASLGVASSGIHYLTISALQRAEASLLAPFYYTEILMGVVCGYVFFGDVPDGWSVAGMACVILVGLYLSREGEAAAAVPAPPKANTRTRTSALV